MARQTTPLSDLIDSFIERFADALATRAQEKLQATMGARISGGTRICPVPGCGKPGAGPRNRWFCREHSRTVPLARQKKLLAEAALKRALPAAGRRGRPGRKLDLSCRVEGCKNKSRGPRFGYICDDHRKKLSAKDQQAARDKWNATHKKGARKAA